MKIVGIIAEYNPFHEGHKYQIDQIRKISNADYIIVAMSGDFVQRGIPALLPKHRRALAALENGIDLVLELPVNASTASAEFFASAGVSLFHALGCVDYLSFGAETSDLDSLSEIANILTNETPSYKKALKTSLQNGLSFPAARYQALLSSLLKPDTEKINDILASPNNILAIEYLKAIQTLNSSMKPLLIQRSGNAYYSEELTNGMFPSATGIRSSISKGSYFEFVNDRIRYDRNADHVYRVLSDAVSQNSYLFPDDISQILHYQLLREDRISLRNYQDLSDDLANRICRQLNTYEGFEQFCTQLKSRELTQTRIQRALLHVLLNIKDASKEVHYARILGFRKDSRELLHEIKKTTKIPMITKLADYEKQLSSNSQGQQQLSETILASNIYESIFAKKTKNPFRNEYTKEVLIV